MSRIIDIGVRLRLQTLFSLARCLIQRQAQLISSIQQLFRKGAEVLCRPGQLAGAYPSQDTFYAPNVVAWAAIVTRPSVISCWSGVPLLPN